MHKARLSLVVLLCTAVITTMMLGWKKQRTVEARIVQVKRGDVYQIVEFTGIIRYADEKYVFAQSNGVIEQLCKASGDRAASGEVILRMTSNEKKKAILAYASTYEELADGADSIAHTTFTNASAVRSDWDCTVRQVLVKEGDVVYAGTPVARISSNQQEIRCNVAAADLEELECGMWAWLQSDEDMLCCAYISDIGVPTVEPISGMQYAEVTLKPEKYIEKKEGEQLEVNVYLSGGSDVRTLPLEAITERGTVWRVTDEGKCTEIPAKIVMDDEFNAWVELPEGLSVAIGEFKEGQFILEVLQ